MADILLSCRTMALLNTQKLSLKLWEILTLIRMPVSHIHIASNHNATGDDCGIISQSTASTKLLLNMFGMHFMGQIVIQKTLNLSICFTLLSKPSLEAGWSCRIKVSLLTLI